MLQECDIHSVAGILKQFLRELPECIFTTAAYNRLFEAYAIQDQELRQDIRACFFLTADGNDDIAGKKNPRKKLPVSA